MKPQLPIEQARNSDLRGSAAALLRAAQRAREVAMRTQTALVVRRNGVLVHDRIIEIAGTPVTPVKA
jgi:hypothetical protein